MRQLLQMTISILAITLALALTACAPIQNTPFGEQTQSSISNLNEASKSRLPLEVFGSQEPLEFSLIADTHANYEDLEEVIGRLNASPAQFVMNLGDMTDLGLAAEFDAFMYFMNSLTKPWFSVIGNHDAIGNGKNIFKRLFGPLNDHFEINGIRYILFNNNNLDFYTEGIDLDWLERTVNESALPVVLFQHVNPFNEEYFSKQQLEQIRRILNSGQVIALFHGHTHKFNTSKYKNVLIQEVGRVQREQYAQVKIDSNTVRVNKCKGDNCEEIIHNYNAVLE